MVKSVLSVAHQGFRDWVVQRLSAMVMAVYFFGLIAYLLLHPGLTFAEWHYLFSITAMKVATLLSLLLLLLHSWVGMWTVFTDYVKPYVICSVLCAIVILTLAAYFFWGLFILGSV